LKEIPGRWRWLDGWPPSDLEETTLSLRADHGLDADPGPEDEHRLRCIPSAGGEASFWWGELTPDQGSLDAAALVYETPPLEEDLTIVGMPRAELAAAADAPLAHWFGRLCDVGPQGTSTLVAGAGLNGSHRDSPTDPQPLVPGEWYRLTVEMHFTGWTFSRGHRIRLAVSNAMWPMSWPVPHVVTTSLRVGGPEGSFLTLPVIGEPQGPGPAFGRPEARRHPPGVMGSGDSFPQPWSLSTEADGTRVAEWEGQYRTELPWSTQIVKEAMRHRIHDAHPEAATVEGDAETDISFDGRLQLWRCRLEISSDASHFQYRFLRQLSEDGRVIREREWEERIPRDHQ
jgi:hypothetical protein